MSEININFRIDGADKAVNDINNLSTSTDGLNNSVKKSDTSVKTYSQQIKALQKELIALGGRTKENAAEFDRLSNSIRELDDAREDLTIGTGQLDDALGALPGPIGAAAGQFKTLDLAFKNGRSALIQLTNQFPLLKNAFVATGIGAIVVIFGLLAAAVMRAFETFEPLKTAVGNLGTAFEIVGDVVQPLVDLIGRGLTAAVNGVARGIAFLTGNLDEYEKKVKAAESTKALQSNLEFEKELFEASKDQYIASERQRMEASIAYRTRINEINEKYKNDEVKRNQLLTAAQKTYFAQINAAEKTAQEEKKKSNQLTDEQIAKLKQAQEATKSILENELLLYAARNIGGLENIKILKELENTYNVITQTINNAKSSTDLFTDTIKLFNTNADEGFTYLNKFMNTQLQFTVELKDELVKFQKESLGAITDTTKFAESVLSLKARIDEARRTNLFSEQTLQDMENYVRNLQSIGSLLQETSIDLNELTKANQEVINASISPSLDAERKARENLQKITDRYLETEIKRLTTLKEGALTQEQATAEANKSLQTLRNLLNENAKFELQINNVNKKVEETNANIQRAIDEGVIVKYIQQNIQAFTTFAQQMTGISTELDQYGFFEVFRKLSEQFPALANITTEQLIEIFGVYKQNFQSVQAQVDALSVNQFSNQYNLELKRLEQQKQIDKERLRQAGATTQQLLQIDEAYANKVKMLNHNLLLTQADMIASTLGMITGQMDQASDLFKGLKYAESVITAISSSIKAYEFALAYGGPAGVVLAPVLAATTFTTQMMAASKILTTPKPNTDNQGGGVGLGANPTYTGYYEQGGLVYGRRHNQGGVMAEMEGGEYVINRRAMMLPGVAEMAQSLNNMSNILTNPTMMYKEPPVIKTYVLSGEITTQQRADKRIKDLSRL